MVSADVIFGTYSVIFFHRSRNLGSLEQCNLQRKVPTLLSNSASAKF